MPERSPLVVVGSINVDYVVRVERRPQPGETVSDGVLELYPGGKGANQAVAAARCGATVELVGCVGSDAAGRDRLEVLVAEGVGTSHVRRVEGTRTGAAFVSLTPDGENSITTAPGANTELGVDDVDAAAPVIAAASVLVAQLEVPLASVVRAAELAGKESIFVLNAAPYCAVPTALLDMVDVLVVNESEAARLARRSFSGVQGAREVAAELLSFGPRAVVVTLGRDGAVVVAPGLDRHLPAPVVRVVDTTGAGDAFVGALAACLDDGWALEDAVAYGVAMGSATTERHGALPVVPNSGRCRWADDPRCVR